MASCWIRELSGYFSTGPGGKVILVKLGLKCNKNVRIVVTYNFTGKIKSSPSNWVHFGLFHGNGRVCFRNVISNTQWRQFICQKIKKVSSFTKSREKSKSSSTWRGIKKYNNLALWWIRGIFVTSGQIKTVDLRHNQIKVSSDKWRIKFWHKIETNWINSKIWKSIRFFLVSKGVCSSCTYRENG